MTRLKSIFITLHKSDGVAYKHANDVYHPCSLNGSLTLASEHTKFKSVQNSTPNILSIHCQKVITNLRKTVGRAFEMHSSWYRSRKYIIGLDLEKISGAGCTGMSTKAGDLPTINFKDCDAPGAAASVPDRVFCALDYGCVLNIQDSGIQIMGYARTNSTPTN